MRESKTLSIAPMVDVSNTHFRTFTRLLTKHAPLYTEMLHHEAVLHNSRTLLPFTPEQHPVILQLGGCDPKALAAAACLAASFHYDAINLNVGCPSPRVQQGMFGACLMKTPLLVRQCMQALRAAVRLPCTVKCRLGVDDFDSYEFIRDFVAVLKPDVTHFIIHARKAILSINPLQNRKVPPLMYDRVYRLKQEFPDLVFEINGGIKTVGEGHAMVVDNGLDGCMVGRMAYENPFELRHVDSVFYGAEARKETDDELRQLILLQYAEYLERLQQGTVVSECGHAVPAANPSVLVKPVINLYNGEKHSARFRQLLSEHTRLKQKPVHQVVREAAKMMFMCNQQHQLHYELPINAQAHLTAEEEPLPQPQVKPQLHQLHYELTIAFDPQTPSNLTTKEPLLQPQPQPQQQLFEPKQQHSFEPNQQQDSSFKHSQSNVDSFNSEIQWQPNNQLQPPFLKLDTLQQPQTNHQIISQKNQAQIPSQTKSTLEQPQPKQKIIFLNPNPIIDIEQTIPQQKEQQKQNIVQSV